jgi:N-acetylmuramoyl-L-alanine amidase
LHVAFLAVAVFAFGANAAAAAADAPRITALRAWPAPDHTRVVLQLSSPAQWSGARDTSETGADRFVVRLPGAALDDGVLPIASGDSAVAAVDLERSDSGTLVLLRLADAARCEAFTVEPFGENPARIVIDVFRHARPAPALPPTSEPDAPAVRRVVIDAGHGGDDWGAKGWGGLVEKRITLDVARRLASVLAQSDPPIETVLTRDGDYFVSLGQRTRVARDARADLFVSIHANASSNRNASGVEVFFVSMTGASDQAAKELAEKENAADLAGGVSPESRADLIASDDILGIIVDATQSETMRRSSHLAEAIVGAVRGSRSVDERGVKQAGFAVLKSIVVPSVLVEVGFLTNKDEAKRLSTGRHRQEIAQLIGRGMVAFLDQEAGRIGLEDYTVRAGETLSGLAQRHRISTRELARLNGIAVGPLRVGQKIQVPR